MALGVLTALQSPAVWAAALGVYCGVYLLLLKKKLPRTWWLPLTKCYFWPMIGPTFVVRRFISPQPYFSVVDDVLLLGAVPLACMGHPRELHDMGVRAVVNMQAEYGGPVAAYAALSPPIEQLHLPVTDHMEPTLGQLQQAVAFISEQVQKGAEEGKSRVLVHCKAGHGRGAAVAFAYLLSEHGLSMAEAQRRLSAVRHVRRKLHRQVGLLEYARAVGATPTDSGNGLPPFIQEKAAHEML